MPQATPKQMRTASEMLASAAAGASAPTPLQSTLEPHRKDYLARIDSFTVSRWFAKPAALSPLECARYGWKTTAPDRLECSLCAARLICVIGQELDGSAAARVTADLKISLGTKHEATCYWRESPLPIDIVRGPDAKGGRDLFIARLRGLAEVLKSTDVPPLTAPNTQLADAAREHQGVISDVKDGLVEVFALAAAGWKSTASTPHGVFVQCECCQARAFLGRADFLVWRTAASNPSKSSAASDGGAAAAAAPDVEPPKITKTPPRKFPLRSELAHSSTKQLAAARIGTARRFGVPAPTALKPAASTGNKRARVGASSDAPVAAKRVRVKDSRDFDPLLGHRGYCPFYQASFASLVHPLSESSPQRFVRQKSSLKLKEALDLLMGVPAPK